MAKRPQDDPRFKHLDIDQFEKLLALQCTSLEVSNYFKMSEDSLFRRIKEHYGENATYAKVLKEKGNEGRISLRRKQFQVAMSGNVSMLIWLGKNWLGQSDTQNVEISNKGENPLKLVYNLEK